MRMHFLSWRSNEELQRIMYDHTQDWRIRQKAEAEWLGRMYPVCKVPGCKGVGKETWATIPVCTLCKEQLSEEQLNYYSELIEPESRTLIYGLMPLMPWRTAKWTKNLSEKQTRYSGFTNSRSLSS